MKSYNNKLIVKPYQHSGKIKANITTGFASVQQKGVLVGLAVMCDAIITVGNENILIKKDQIAFIPEEVLCTSPWSTKTYECDQLKEKFIIIDWTNVIFISEASSTGIPIPTQGAKMC